MLAAQVCELQIAKMPENWPGVRPTTTNLDSESTLSSRLLSLISDKFYMEKIYSDESPSHKI